MVQFLALHFRTSFLPSVYTTRQLPTNNDRRQNGPGLPSCPAEGRTCCWAPASWWVWTGGRRHLRSDWALLYYHWSCNSAVNKSSKTTGLICLQLPLRSDACPKPYCSAAVPTPSLNPAAHPELQPQWVQAHKPSLLPLIATNHHPCALMSEDLRQRSAPGIYTAVKNESAILTLVTQRQQQLCRDPEEVFTKNEASQQMTKGRGISPLCFKGWMIFEENPLLNKYWGAQKQPAYDCGEQLRPLCRIEVRQSMFAPQSMNTGKIKFHI